MMPMRRVEQEDPERAGHRRGHGVGPDQQGAIGGGATDHPVGHDPRDSSAEAERQAAVTELPKRIAVTLQRVEVELESRNRRGEVLKPDELGLQAEGVLAQQGLPRAPGPPAR